MHVAASFERGWEDGEEYELDGEEIEEKSRELRDALENLFATARLCSVEDTPFEEQFIVLVSQYPDVVLKRSVLMTAAESIDSSFTGRLPIHLACDNDAPISVIRRLLDCDEDNKSVLAPDKWGDLPIHTACSRKNLEVVRLLLDGDADKHTVLVRDNYGSLPLHMACRYGAPAELIRLLLDSDGEKKSLFTEGIHGQLPIHVACRCDAPPEVIRALLDGDVEKKTVLRGDNVGRLPIHVYLLRNKNTEAIRLLLEGMLCHRVQRVGLDLWKTELEGLLDSLGTHERDMITRDKLDAICAEIKELMERAFLLELTAWKASCLAFAGTRKSMDDIVELGATDQAFDLCEYKTERRFKCGADVIVPGVLSFLEDERVIELVKELIY